LIAIFAITASATAQIKVLSNGNVGIGVNNTNPTYKLDVIGAVKFTRPNWGYDPIYFEWATTSGYPRIYSTSPLWVGLSNYPVYGLYATWAYFQNPISNSDERLKENIKPLGNTLSKLLSVEGKRFNYKREIELEGIPDYEELSNKETFGFIAQELEKVFPELVYAPNSLSNYYGVNYNGMIPVLLEAIKEQQYQIEKLQTIVDKQATEMMFLQEQVSTLSQENNPTNVFVKEKENKGKGKLFQNTPNPFSKNTEIKFEIPENSMSARLLIHDMQGAEIKSYPITTKGTGSLTIQGSEIQAGMYMYTLLVNNAIVDTKRMILTK